MCSHYEAPTPAALRTAFAVEPPAEPGQLDLYPYHRGVFLRRPSAADAGDEAVPRLEALVGSFGLIPRWTKDRKDVRSTFNARSETAATKNSFREPWRRQQHCIIPAALISCILIISTEPPYHAMPPRKKKAFDVTTATHELEVPQPLSQVRWQHWFQTGLAPIWIAAFLTLDINPTKTIEATLKSRHPDTNFEYEKRCRLIKRNYSHSPLLPRIEHDDASTGQYGSVVNLTGLAQFCEERRLERSERFVQTFLESLSPPGDATTSGGSESAHTKAGERTPEGLTPAGEDELIRRLAEVFRGELHSLPKGARYQSLRLGALCAVLHDVVYDKIQAQSLRRGNNLNFSALNKLMADHLVHLRAEDLPPLQESGSQLRAAYGLIRKVSQNDAEPGSQPAQL